MHELLQCISVCLVHILSVNSALIRALRALQQFRMLVEMHCTTESRLAFTKCCIEEYELAYRVRFRVNSAELFD